MIVAAFPYKVKELPPKNISRYAAVCDYHEVVKLYLGKAAENLKKMFPENSFEAFCDNSPINERLAAAKAGLGVLGKNGLLITKEYGSFVFLGEIVCDIQTNAPIHEITYCNMCSLCEKNCPVSLNKDMCLSHLSQKKNLNKTELEILKENKILWGCDICAENCPYNKDAKITYIKEFLSSYRDEFSLGEDYTFRAYTWRGEEAIKRNYVNLFE